MTPLTKTIWNSLSDKQRWDVMAAFRGPDLSTYSENVKWFSTSVIRGKMRDVLRVGGAVNKDLNLVVIPYGGLSDNATGKKSLRFSDSHFFQHAQEAAEILGIPICYLPAARYLSALKSAPANYQAEFGAALIKTLLAGIEDKTSLFPQREAAKEAVKELTRHLTDMFGITIKG